MENAINLINCNSKCAKTENCIFTCLDLKIFRLQLADFHTKSYMQALKSSDPDLHHAHQLGRKDNYCPRFVCDSYLVVVRGRLYIFTKKEFPLILQLHCVPLVPQIYQKILLSDPRWRSWFFEPRPFLPWEN